MKSPPSSQLPERPRGSPAVAMKPARDSASTFCLTRSTPRVAAGARPSSSRVRTTRPPKLVWPARPVALRPARIGTSWPSTSPMRRLKKGSRVSPSRPAPKAKMSDPSRKKVRFSGK